MDRVLRPGGYWILSGPPINWKQYYQSWQRSKEELQQEQEKIEEIEEFCAWKRSMKKVILPFGKRELILILVLES